MAWFRWSRASTAFIIPSVLIPLVAGQGCPLLNRTPDTRPLVDEPVPAFVIDLISQFAHEPVANPPVRILRYTYRGEVVYYVPPRCCDQASVLYDSNGNVICVPDGGLTGNADERCTDFFDTRTDETLIWKDTRTYP